MRYLLPTARPILEDLAGTLVFYLIFLATGSALAGVVIGLMLGIGQIGWHWWRRESIPALLAMGVALTALLGGMTLVVHDVRLILLKPSIIYAAIGVTMLRRGWLVRYVPAIARELLPAAIFDRTGWTWAALMFATAVLNFALVAVLPPRGAATALAIWATGSKIVLFAVHYLMLRARAWRVYIDRATDA